MSNQQIKPTVSELKSRMNASLEKFLALIDTYSEEQMVTPTDAAGWTVRDHLTHHGRMGRWNRSLIAP